jgi:hypothetical protein
MRNCRLTTGLFAARSSRASDDDDEFIVPDDSEDDAASRSSRVSKRSSRISLLSDDDDEEENARPQKPKKSLGTAGRPSLKKAHATSGSGNASTNNFLTAAEQRAQTTKDEKKSQEDPFSFLVDVRDVIYLNVSWQACGDAHLRFCRKTVSDLGNLVMTLGHCSSLRKPGMTSALSRNRCSNPHPNVESD